MYASLAGGRLGPTRAWAASERGPAGSGPRPVPVPAIRQPGSRPRPDLAAGTDVFPGIQHVVVLMMENHSFDNYFGVLGRGDGFTLGPDRSPLNTTADSGGGATKAFPLSTPCQPIHLSMQSWKASHAQF